MERCGDRSSSVAKDADSCSVSSLCSEKYSFRGTPSRAATKSEFAQKQLPVFAGQKTGFPTHVSMPRCQHVCRTEVDLCDYTNNSRRESPEKLFDIAVEQCPGEGGAGNPYVAVAGGNLVNVYVFVRDDNTLKLVRHIVDEDEDEIFYTCIFTRLNARVNKRARHLGETLLLFAGETGVVTVYSVEMNMALYREPAHIGCISELCCHPTLPHVVATASADESVGVFSVEGGISQLLSLEVADVSSAVQSVSFNATGDLLLSGDLAHQVFIWKINIDELQRLSDTARKSVSSRKSRRDAPGGGGAGAYLRKVTMPLFLTTVVGSDYVDAVVVIGEKLFLTKCANSNAVTMWRMNEEGMTQTLLDYQRDSGADLPKHDSLHVNSVREDFVYILTEMHLDERFRWGDKLSRDASCRLVAAGGDNGIIYVWDLKQFMVDCNAVPCVKYEVPAKWRQGTTCHLRKVLFSSNSQCLFALDSDNAVIHTFALALSAKAK